MSHAKVSIAVVVLLFNVGRTMAQQAAETRRPAARNQLPEGVEKLADLEYSNVAGKKLLLDLYLPVQRDRPLPVIIWIHGGGWAAGDKADCGARRMLERGYAVASVNYRLSGEAVFPAQIIDCKAAVRWLRANASRYKLDADHFGVWGSSAGGHLVALMGTTGDLKEFDQGENLDRSSRVQAVCDFYGPTDLLQMDAHALAGAVLKHNSPNSPESRLIGGPILENSVKAARINPIAYIKHDAPPFLIVHGDKDPTVPMHQSQLLHDALTGAGVTARFHIVEGAGHGIGIGGPAVDKAVNAFFDRNLKGKGELDEPATGTTRSAAPPMSAAPGGKLRDAKITWAQVRQREGVEEDGKVTREAFKGPPGLFDLLDRNHDGVLSRDDFGDAPPAPGAK